MTDPEFWYLNKGVNVRLSEHFESHEFDCHCQYPECTKTIVSKQLILLLEKLRWVLGHALSLESGFRCERHNTDIKGEEHSYHMRGMAADIQSSDRTEKARASQYLKTNGFGIYPTFFHVDVRGFKSWWSKK